VINRTPGTILGPRKRKRQRYFCDVCKRYFTSTSRDKGRRYSQDFRKEAVRRYVEGNTSLRRIAKSLGASPPLILSCINEFGERCFSLLEVKEKLNPKWSGNLGIDGKPIKIKGEELTVLLAVDQPTQGLVHLDLVDRENEEDCTKFLLTVRDKMNYPIRAIVSDLGKGKVLIDLIEKLFPDIPHQAGVVHFARYSESYHDAEELFIRLWSMKQYFQTGYQKRILKSLKRHFKLLTAHFFHPELPRDNNITENIVKKLNRKLKLIDGFKNKQNAYNFLKLWADYYRFEPCTASNYGYRNGKSPLNLAQVQTPNLDWLTSCQRV
jgi:transposase-like protein